MGDDVTPGQESVCSDCGAETVRDEAHPSSRQCPNGHGRRCRDCGQHSEGAWMSGVCDVCYRIGVQQRTTRDLFDLERHRRRSRRDAWQEGFDAARDATNPYADLSYFERTLLDQHPWLHERTDTTP